MADPSRGLQLTDQPPGDLEAFSVVVSAFEITNSWQMSGRRVVGGQQIDFRTLSNNSYTVLRSTNLADWLPWTNLMSTGAVARCFEPWGANRAVGFYRVRSEP